MYTEKSIIDRIEILEDGQIQVRRADKVYKDGAEIAKMYHRHVLAPGENLAGQDKRVADVAGLIWTADVVKTYKDSITIPKK
jgi:hypothetical protein